MVPGSPGNFWGLEMRVNGMQGSPVAAAAYSVVRFVALLYSTPAPTSDITRTTPMRLLKAMISAVELLTRVGSSIATSNTFSLTTISLLKSTFPSASSAAS